MSSLELEVSKVVERAVELIVVSSSMLAMRLVSVFTQKTRNNSHLPLHLFYFEVAAAPAAEGCHVPGMRIRPIALRGGDVTNRRTVVIGKMAAQRARGLKVKPESSLQDRRQWRRV